MKLEPGEIAKFGQWRPVPNRTERPVENVKDREIAALKAKLAELEKTSKKPADDDGMATFVQGAIIGSMFPHS